MNDFDGVVGRQVKSIVDVLHRQQEVRCREIVAAAKQRAARAISDGRRKLYERQRRALTVERQRRQHEILTAQSRIESQARRRAFEQYERVLETAWPRLAAALDQRWADADSRRAWCEMIVTEAAATLGTEDWLIEHPDHWSAGDRDAVAAILPAHSADAASFEADPGIRAGLRIRVATACLDGTASGLLADRHAVEALILASWEAQREKEQTDG